MIPCTEQGAGAVDTCDAEDADITVLPMAGEAGSKHLHPGPHPHSWAETPKLSGSNISHRGKTSQGRAYQAQLLLPTLHCL